MNDLESLKTITARIPAGKVAELDQLAQGQDRDRSYLINEAIDQYLAHRRWMLEEVRKAMAEVEAGECVPEDEMEAVFAKWTQ
jgi:predicted transcriptional regulator